MRLLYIVLDDIANLIRRNRVQVEKILKRNYYNFGKRIVRIYILIIIVFVPNARDASCDFLRASPKPASEECKRHDLMIGVLYPSLKILEDAKNEFFIYSRGARKGQLITTTEREKNERQKPLLRGKGEKNE